MKGSEISLAPILYFIRHGETDWNAELRLQGQRDIPINAKGREQAISNGKRLADILPDASGFQFVASPLGRTRETMELLRKGMGLVSDDYSTDERLIEVSFGELEGMTLTELAAQRPNQARQRKENRWNFVPPNGESYASASPRVLDWLSTINRNTVVVSHGGVGRILRKHFLSLTDVEIQEYTVRQNVIYNWSMGQEEIL